MNEIQLLLSSNLYFHRWWCIQIFREHYSISSSVETSLKHWMLTNMVVILYCVIVDIYVHIIVYSFFRDLCKLMGSVYWWVGGFHWRRDAVVLSKYLDKPLVKIKITGKKQLNFIHPPLKNKHIQYAPSILNFLLIIKILLIH